MTVPFIEENDQIRARHEHLEALRRLVGNVYPNKFQRSNVTETTAGEDTIASIVSAFRKFEPQVNEGQKPSADALESLPHVAGIHDVEVTSLHLEDIYCALLARKEAKP